MTFATHDIFGQWIAVVATLGGIVLGGWLGRRGRRDAPAPLTPCAKCGMPRPGPDGRWGRYCCRCGGDIVKQIVQRVKGTDNTEDATNAPPAFLPTPPPTPGRARGAVKCDRCHSAMVLYVDDNPDGRPARIWRCKCGNAIYADALPVPAPDPVLAPTPTHTPLPLCPRCKTLVEPRNWRDKSRYWVCPNCILVIMKRRPLRPIPYPDNTRPVKCDLCQSEMYRDTEGYPDGRPRPVLRCQCGNTYDLPRDRRH